MVAVFGCSASQRRLDKKHSAANLRCVAPPSRLKNSISRTSIRKRFGFASDFFKAFEGVLAFFSSLTAQVVVAGSRRGKSDSPGLTPLHRGGKSSGVYEQLVRIQLGGGYADA
jgi:hypothetical protein